MYDGSVIGLDTGRFITKAQPPGAGFPLPHPVVQSNHRIVPVTCSMTVGRGEGAAMEAPYTVLISLQVSQALPLQGCYGAGLALPINSNRRQLVRDLSSSHSLQTTGLQQCPELITHNHPQLCTSQASGLTKRGVADMLLGVRGGAAARLDQSRRPQQCQQPQQQRPARHGLEAPGHDTAEPQLSLWGLSDQTDSPGHFQNASRPSPLALGFMRWT